ncbi:MAG TPA: biotin/lipoate A/B protein ligase family protein [Candidatus Bathyarchaeia archaeon]|nr:biotin/lipoate A/B protein ligase family protein [Candidatus Bathyarchaeia archaeon]
MTESWRLLSFAPHDAYTNMAIDEAISRFRSQDKVPNTLRFYRWKPSAVSIGYFQLMDKEVNLEACRELGIDVIRRITGGGAVYHDYMGEITYSIIAKGESANIPSGIDESYGVICKGIIIGLKRLGIEAVFAPINDLLVNSKKISGNAQTRRWGIVLQHGTILVDSDIRTMFTVLKVSQAKIDDKMIKSVEERVTTINREMGRKIDFLEIVEALRTGFTEALDMDLHPAELTKEEEELARQLVLMKYKTEKWNLMRPDQY